MSVQVHVIEAAWAEYREALQRIREIVFIVEQDVPRELEWDGEDEESTHFLAINELGQHIGCARLLPSGQIGRMAVLQEYRGTGVGAQLLDAAVAAGRDQGFDRLYLHAQSYAEAFYRKGGFLPFGQPFEEAGIAHIAMEMKLPLAFDGQSQENRPAVRQQQVRPALQAEVSQAQQFDGLDDTLEALLNTINATRRKLLILNPYLDHELFDHPETADAISRLARSAPRVHIDIIIFDSKLIVDRGHKIVELARRLDQKIKIRLLNETANAETSTFVCGDLDAYWLMPSYEKYKGVADTANPVTCKRLSEVFATAWEKSREDTELRTLRI